MEPSAPSSPAPRTAAGRRLADMLALLSLLLLLASVALWVRSYRRVDMAAFYLPGGRVQVAAAWRGGLFLFFSSVPIENRSWHDVDLALNQPLEEARGHWDLLDAEAANKWSWRGFSMHSKPRDAFAQPGARFVLLRVPLWVIALLAAPLPAAALRRRLQRWRWRRANRCQNCGYDLRATSGRCPECGAAIATQSASAISPG
jgi:hypothetical protein